MRTRILIAVCTALALTTTEKTSAQTPFTDLDVFQVEYASDVQIAPDGQRVAYVRNAMSIMRRPSNTLAARRWGTSSERRLLISNFSTSNFSLLTSNF